MKFTSSQAQENLSKPKVSKSRRMRLLISYAPDWIITIVLAAIFFALDNVEGYKRVFSVSDTSLRHPYAVHERIPNLALGLIAVLAPFILIILVNLLTVRSFWDAHNGTLGLILGLALAGSITQFTKITVGRPRPDVVDRCQPVEGSVDPEFGLSTFHICTQTDEAIMRDGFRSFPSGHSSLSFAGLGFLAFYLAGKLHLFDKRGHAGKAWIALSPFAAAALVAISRSMDYRHHWHDILVGSLLGVVMAYFSYRQYYPPLTSRYSHRPYSPRIPAEDDNHTVLPTHNVQGEHGRNQSISQPLSPRYNGGSGVSTPSEEQVLEADGTVRRGGPGDLEDVWKMPQQSSRNSPIPVGRPLNPHDPAVMPSTSR